MAKLTLSDIASGYGSTTKHNANNDLIEAAVENTLSRDGTGPNEMEANLDMNSYRILNLPDAVANQEPVTLAQAAVIAGVDNPLTQESVGAVLYPRTAAEVTAAVTPTNYYYPPGNVLRYGADGTGVANSSTAFQNAVNSLDATYGGRVTVPAGVYSVGDVLISNATITNGGVLIDMDPRATINALAGSTYVFKFYGTSATSLIQHCGVRGGRIIGAIDDTNYGVWFVNCANWFVENTSIRQFYSTSRSTRAGIYTQYALWGSIINANIQVCDFGMNFENDATNTYRQTTISVYGGNVQTCYRAMRVDDGCQIHAYSTSFENSSIGVLYDYSRTTGTNNFSCSLNNCYFERNGKHVKITEHGTAITRGINIEGCFFENVGTTYVDTSSFEDAGAGDYKVDIDGQLNTIAHCYWSTAPATADIIVQTGATDNYIGLQNRLTANLTITDNGTTTVLATTPVGAGSSTVISAPWRWTNELRLSNNIKLRGLNNAGAAYRDLLHISTSDNTVVGNVDQSTKIYSVDQPDWYDGSTTHAIATSTATTGGTGSAGAGNQYVQLNINGTVYKVLHDGTV